jgi:hypothetical protein
MPAVADLRWWVTAVIADRAVHADHVMHAAAVVAATATAVPQRQAYQRQPDSQIDSLTRPPVPKLFRYLSKNCDSL